MMRRLLILFLSVALGLASVSMAVARTQARTVGQITICSGYGVVTVAVDASGSPVGTPLVPAHLCPDCLAGLTLGPLPVQPQVSRPATPAQPVWPVAIVAPSGHASLAPQARGPPFVI